MKRKIIKYYLQMLMLIGVLSVSVVACDNSLPSIYKPKGASLSIDTLKVISVKDQDSISVPVLSSSSWSVKPSESWCKPRAAFYMGSKNFICSLDLNRGDAPRTCTVYVEVVTASGIIRDSLLLTQDVSIMPEISLLQSSMKVSSAGETIEVTVKHNFGVNIALSDISADASSWLSLSTDHIDGDSKDVQESVFSITCLPNTDIDRTATLNLTSTMDGLEIPVVLTIEQKSFKPALISFFDDFSTYGGDGSKFIPSGSDSWTYQCTKGDYTPVIWDKKNNWGITKMLQLYLNSTSVETLWLITPPMNVKAMVNKKISYKLGAGNNNASTGSFKIVYSTDYQADASKATWIELQDATITESGIMPPETHSIELSGNITTLERVVFAVEYKERQKAYRFDDFKID